VGLGEVVAVALGGVDQVDAKSPSLSQQLVDLVLGEALAPLAAKLPDPNPDDRHRQSRLAQPAVPHARPFDQRLLHCEAWHKSRAASSAVVSHHPPVVQATNPGI
jgi:hypothetical protein